MMPSRDVLMERARELARDEWVARSMLLRACTMLDARQLDELVDLADEYVDELPPTGPVSRLYWERWGVHQGVATPNGVGPARSRLRPV